MWQDYPKKRYFHANIFLLFSDMKYIQNFWCRRSGVLLITFNKFHTYFFFFYCWLCVSTFLVGFHTTFKANQWFSILNYNSKKKIYLSPFTEIDNTSSEIIWIPVGYKCQVLQVHPKIWHSRSLWRQQCISISFMITSRIHKIFHFLQRAQIFRRY